MDDHQVYVFRVIEIVPRIPYKLSLSTFRKTSQSLIPKVPINHRDDVLTPARA